MIGGAGVDRLSGGTEADKFVFGLASDSGKGSETATQHRLRARHRQDHGPDRRWRRAVATRPSRSLARRLSAEGQVRAFFEGDHTVIALNTAGTSGAKSQSNWLVTSTLRRSISSSEAAESPTLWLGRPALAGRPSLSGPPPLSALLSKADPIPPAASRPHPLAG